MFGLAYNGEPHSLRTQLHTVMWDPLYFTDYSILYMSILVVFTQVHQHLLDNVGRPISKDVEKMESTLLTLDVENHLMSSAI